MKKQIYTLKIDPEFRDLIPPLSDDEHEMLEKSIVRDGCDTPLVVWNGIIVDGHNRYEICLRHQIPFTYDEHNFENKEAAMFWMLEHQLARRNLNSYQRSHLVNKFEPMLKRLAEIRVLAGKAVHPPQNSAEGSAKGETREKLARMAGVSRDTIAKVKHLDANADEETKKKLRTGEISIHKAYTDLVNKEHDGETRICDCCHTEKPFTEFTIPNNCIRPRSICKDCEAKAKQITINADEQSVQHETGIQIKDGKTAHVATGIPDDPAMFYQVVDLLKHAQNAYLAAFESTIDQYRPTMISEEHSGLIRELIDYVADTTEDLLNRHLNIHNKEVL